MEGARYVGPPGDGVYAITEAGPHHRVWVRTIVEEMPGGPSKSVTQSYVELGSGLNRLDENQRWVPAEARFDLIPGAAVSLNTAHKVILAPSPTDEVPVDLLTPDNHRLTSRILGISYYSPRTGESVMIAETRPTQGALVAPHQIVYEDAFDGGFAADIRYTVTLGGLEQDIILRQQPPPPSDFQIKADDVRIEIITEFIDTVPPLVIEVEEPRARSVEDPLPIDGRDPEFLDHFLSFGAMHIGSGAAFQLGDDSAGAVQTRKRWDVIEGRNILFEALALTAAAESLSKLPPADQASLTPDIRATPVAGRAAFLPQPKIIPSDKSQSILQARYAPPKEAYVIDYEIVSSATNVTFRGDTTYFVTNAVTLSGLTVLEGGAVIKFAKGGAKLLIPEPGSLDCRTALYWPAILTAIDDDSVGQSIPGSTGQPTGNYSVCNLDIAATNRGTLKYVNSRHSATGLYMSSNYVLEHSQIGKCAHAVAARYGGSPLQIRNILITDCTNAFTGMMNQFAILNSTVRDVVTLNAGFGIYVTFTNSIIAGCGSYAAYGYTNEYGVYSTVSTGFFQSVGGATAYLAEGSIHRNTGTTNINPELLAELRGQTTYPPMILDNTITVSTIFTPQAYRDLDAPDLGYHYPPLDYLVSGLSLTNVSLLLTNGVALGYYGSYGINLFAGGKLISEGRPTLLNRVVRYRTVQEGPISSSEPWSHAISCGGSYSPTPEVWLRYTELAIPPSHNSSSQIIAPYSGAMLVDLCDTQIRGGAVMVYGTGGITLSASNCLFERVFGYLSGSTVTLYNNTFFGGTAAFIDNAGEIYTVNDNFFDRSSVSKRSYATWSLGNNGYVTNYSRLAPNSTNDVILASSPAYETGGLGSYYLPSGIALINAGSRSATNAGLYHHTVLASQTKETNSVVDIGFHYPSLLAYDAAIGFSGSQGANNWRYQRTTSLAGLPDANSPDLPSYDSNPSYPHWHYDGGDSYCHIWNGGQHPGNLYDSVRTFVCPYAGTVLIDSAAYDGHYGAGSDGTRARIVKDGIELVPWTQITEGSTSTTGIPLNVSAVAVAGGTRLFFQLNRNSSNSYDSTQWAPRITYLDSSLDSDGDGIPDILEDRNGNGTTDSGETLWNSGSDVGLKVLITQPKANANMP